MEFTVKLDRYEGPYTKLLELIEQRKLSITEISLVSVADEYIAYIKTLEQKNLVDISQFIVVASTLIVMKAQSLLPGVVYTEEEEKQVHDLERKLELYAMLTNACTKLSSVYMKKILHSREYMKYKGDPVFVPDNRVTSIFLQSIASLTLMSFVSPKQLVKVAVEQALRIENVIENLLERVRTAKEVTLQSLADTGSTIEERKKLLIVNFIAMLELLRSGSINAVQHADGGEINILKSN
ncbi:MAG: segregation/condensation protein A [Candidatus Pacebacteria bacterium]|nr:segregation/condensation protein A [Candidatus Paceibacterota bacterium]